jgi:hypothetical protein
MATTIAVFNIKPEIKGGIRDIVDDLDNPVKKRHLSKHIQNTDAEKKEGGKPPQGLAAEWNSFTFERFYRLSLLPLISNVARCVGVCYLLFNNNHCLATTVLAGTPFMP